MHGEPGAWLRLQRPVRRAQQVKLHRRLGALRGHGHVFQHVSALDDVERTQHRYLQAPLTLQRRRARLGQRPADVEVGVRHAAVVRPRQVAGHAAQWVVRRHDDVARRAQQGRMGGTPGFDTAVSGRGSAPQAFMALRRAGFAAVAVGPVGEGDLRANAEIVVHREVAAHAERLGQAGHGCTVVQKMVKVHMAHAEVAQHLKQRLETRPLQGKAQFEGLVGAGQAQADALPGRRTQQQELGLRGQQRRQFAHVALGAATAPVQHGQHQRPPAGGHARCVHRQPRAARRVALHKAQHLGFVARVQAAQRLHGGLLARALAGAKAHAAKVTHKGVERMQVAPARPGGALAKIVFFAVALAEMLDIEQTHLGQRVAADVHAKAHAGGHIDRLAGVDAGEQRVERGRVPAGGHGVVLAEARVAANGGVVGKGRDAGHPGVAVGGGPQTVEPVAGHFGVAVEQQHVVRRRQRHAAVHGADEAEVFVVLQQQDAGVGGGHGTQPVAQLGLGAGVVDEHQAPRRAARRQQHRLHAAARVAQALVDGHDDIDGGSLWSHGRAALPHGPRGASAAPSAKPAGRRRAGSPPF